AAQAPRGQRDQAPTAVPAGQDAGTTAEPELALLDDSVARLAESARQSAQALLAAKDYPGALKALQQAHELDPKHAGAAVQLGELYALLGNYPRAEQIYRAALALDAENPAPYLGLSELLARDKHDPARLNEAAGLLARARELRGNDPAVILRQARVAALSGRFDDAQSAYLAYSELAGRDDEIKLEIGDFYRAFDRTDDALRFYRAVGGTPEAAKNAAQRIFELDAEREARALGLAQLSQKDEPIAAQARELAQKARMLQGRGERAEAERLVRRAISLAPGFGAARAELGDLLRAAGRSADAELEYLRALALDPTQVDVHLRLAELYLADAQSERASEAALILERALAARPELSALHLRLSRAYQRAGDLPRALFHAKRFLAQAPPGADRDAALALQRTLERLLGATHNERAGGVALEALEALEVGPIARARAYLARGRTDAALTELRQVPNVLRTSEVLMLEARVLHAAGRLSEAAQVLQNALGREPGYAEAQEELGLVLWALGRERAAGEQLASCARARPTCAFELARLEARADRGVVSALYDAGRLSDLLSARARLTRLAERALLPMRGAELQSLRERIDERLFALALAAGLLAAVLLSALLWLRARVLGGSDVAALIEQHPEAGPEAMRILSSIRHEVLKHNSMALAGVTQALQRDEPVADKAAHLERALFGAHDESPAAEPSSESEHEGPGARSSAHGRLLGYAEELRGLGRAHGVRLNLTRRDRALGPLLAGFARLARARGALRDVAALGPAARRRLQRTLELAGQALNERGYSGLRETLDRIRFCELNVALLERIFARTRSEPAFAAASIAPLALDPDSSLPCSVRMPEHAFADVLTNLLRNAIQASLALPVPVPVPVPDPEIGRFGHGHGRVYGAEIEIGLSVRVEVDAATGDEHVACSVLDRASGDLPARALRARYIEAGLGLTADLVARYEGMLDVEPAKGWSKAVVLRLPGAGSRSVP
ncbi:MAG TPA: tetratricopeptide repeat protein, partial [Polyangiales bacterium]|nr:tetratricopeptide repeat protein [Polyangiales bacterium]